MSYIGYQPSQLATAPFAVNTFTGDGSTTTFTLSQAVPGANEAMVEVVVENVQQNPIDAYTIGGGTNTSLIFSEAPISGAAIYVIHKGEGTYNLQPSTGSVTSTSLDPVLRNFTVDTFTGNGSATTYTLTDTPYSANSIIVTVDGILQTATTNYTVSGTTLSFGTDAPAVGAAITVLHLGFSTGNKSVADGTITPTKISSGGPSWTSGGLVGIGTASPSAWSGSKALQIKGTGLSGSVFAFDSGVVGLATNYYFNGADKYAATGFATRYYQLNGIHAWNTAASGTGDATITFTESMRIDSAGLVGIGNSAPAYRLDILQAVDGVSGINVRNTSAGTSARAVVLLSQDTNVAASAIWVNSSLNTNFAGANSLNLYNGLNAPIGIFTGGTQRMTIDSSGNVGIATTSPSTYGKFAVVGDGYFSGNLGVGVIPTVRLHVKGADNTTAALIVENLNNTNGILQFGSASTDYQIVGGSYQGDLRLNAPTGATIDFSINGAVKVSVNASGNLKNIGTISVGNATPSTSGAGITFPATQSASSDANTLDDYEEGTWTPAITPSTSGTITLKNITARYTKVGRLINVWFNAQVNTISSPLGRMGLSGLPFSTTGTPIGAVALINGFNTFTGSTGALIESSTTANIDRYNSGSIASDLASFAAVNGYIFFSATYDTNS